MALLVLLINLFYHCLTAISSHSCKRRINTKITSPNSIISRLASLETLIKNLEFFKPFFFFSRSKIPYLLTLHPSSLFPHRCVKTKASSTIPAPTIDYERWLLVPTTSPVNRRWKSHQLDIKGILLSTVGRLMRFF